MSNVCSDGFNTSWKLQLQAQENPCARIRATQTLEYKRLCELDIEWVKGDLEKVSNNQAMGFPGGSDHKESACNAGDPGSIPGSERSPWRS